MIWTALVLVAVVGCTSVSEDQRFEELGQRYLDELTALSPVSATFLGDHRFDSELDHVNEEVRDEAAIPRTDPGRPRKIHRVDCLEPIKSMPSCWRTSSRKILAPAGSAGVGLEPDALHGSVGWCSV